MSDVAEGLRALRSKYREIRRLRVAHAAGDTDNPRSALGELSRAFPGALRELDELPMGVIDARLAALDAALRGDTAPPDWAAAQVAYHGWMRLCLRAKRLAAIEGLGITELLERLRSVEPEGPGEPASRTLSAQLLQAVLRPPGGRLNPWVFQQVGASLGRPAAAIEAALYVRSRADPE